MALILAAVLFVVLLLSLAYVLWGSVPGTAGLGTWRVPTLRGDLERTLRVLVAAMQIFALVVVVWAGAAGVMRTAWLYGMQPDGIAKALAGWSCRAPDCGGRLWAFLALQVARAVGGVLLIALAAGLAGALIGFLFGIPREISGTAAPTASAPPRTASSTPASSTTPDWRLSTNLTQISDWLTKVIVGVGLVELKSGATAFIVASNTIAGWLFEMRHGSPALVPAVFVGGGVIGFLYAYIYTVLVISPLIADVGQRLNRLTPFGPLGPADLPGIDIAAGAVAPPTAEQLQRDLPYAAIRFEDLVADPTVARDQVLNWARAMTTLGDYRAAAQAYRYLVLREP